MQAQDIDLKTMLKFDPESGRLILGSGRMLLFRQESFALLRRMLYEQLGNDLAKSILTQFGYGCGKEDYYSLSTTYEWDSETDLLGAGPTMHTWEGIVRAEPTFLEFDRESGHFHMKGLWRNSYEAEIHKAEFSLCDHPSCYSLTGYASGYGTGFFGSDTLAIETKCVAQGDPHCEFEIRALHEWGVEADPWREALKPSNYTVMLRELEEKLRVIEAQQAAIKELSTPVMEVWEGVLCLPIVGMVDSARAAAMTETLLDQVVASGAECVIIDLTGIDIMDTMTAGHFIKMARSIRLLGAEPMLTGISPAVAQTLVQIGVELSDVKTLRNLREGLRSYLAKKASREARRGEASKVITESRDEDS